MSPIRLAIFISGSGSTMQSVLDSVSNKSLYGVEPVVVISSDPHAAGLKKARDRGAPTEVVERKKSASLTEFGENLLKILKRYNADHIAQLGWMPLTPPNVIEQFKGSIFNQHPGPLDPGNPDFGGKGMHGIHVHAAVLAYQWLTGEHFPTEATTHLVTEEFDRGKVISAALLKTGKPVSIVPRDFFEKKANLNDLRSAAEKIQAALLPHEHQNVIKTIQMFAEQNVTYIHRNKPLIPAENIDMLGYAKNIAAKII